MIDVYITSNNITRTLSSFGLYLLKGSLSSLFEYPSGKTPMFNDWHERHGLDVDMNSFAVATRVISLMFSSSNNKISDFLKFINIKPYFILKVANVAFTLRFNAVQSFETTRDYSIYKLSFVEDNFPMSGQFAIFKTGISLGDKFFVSTVNSTTIDLSQCGFRLLQGSYAEIIKPSATKSNLTRTFAAMKGAIYDNSSVVYKDKDVTLSLLATHSANYFVLFNILTRKTITSFLYGAKAYKIFYKSSKIDDIFLGPNNNDFWCKFNLTLCFYDGYFL